MCVSVYSLEFNKGLAPDAVSLGAFVKSLPNSWFAFYTELMGG